MMLGVMLFRRLVMQVVINTNSLMRFGQRTGTDAKP